MSERPSTPAEHYRAAAEDAATAYVVEADRVGFFLARAQFHATMATVPYDTYQRARDMHQQDLAQVLAEV